MRLLVGIFVVVLSVLGGFVFAGGNILVLWQPAEILIIVGVGIGSFIIANSSQILNELGSILRKAKEGNTYTSQDYLQLLLLLFSICKMAKKSGILSLEKHFDNPLNSEIFKLYPKIINRKMALNFICDYFRLITVGCENPIHLSELMEQELDVFEQESGHISSVLQNLADACPALGIVAAVLGVILTMGAIDQPPAILGKLIGGALVGTFLGILMCYGFIGPIASSFNEAKMSDLQFLKAARSAIIAYLNGMPPIVAVEFARKNIDQLLRPTFNDLENATKDIK